MFLLAVLGSILNIITYKAIVSYFPTTRLQRRTSIILLFIPSLLFVVFVFYFMVVVPIKALQKEWRK